MTVAAHIVEQKNYIQRQAKYLLRQSLSPPEVLEKSLSILQDPDFSKQAQQKLEENNSLLLTFESLGVIDAEPKILEAMEAKDSASGLKALSSILNTKESISDVFRLLKTRLMIGIGYATWLSGVAAVVTAVIGYNVLPTFEELFAGFGSTLPAVTQLVLDWNNSLFSPSIIAIMFILLLTYVQITLVKMAKQSKPNGSGKFIPFINKVIDFTRHIECLNQLKLLADVGYSYPECRELVASIYQNKVPIDNLTEQQLEVADSNSTLTDELAYHIDQSLLNAESIVVKAARKLSITIMAVVASFIILIIFASYLPIFQMGNVQ